MRARPLLIPLTLLLSACAPSTTTSTPTPPKPPTATDLTFSYEGKTYAARLTLPPEPRHPPAALLLAGGSVADLHWTVPAFVTDPQSPNPIPLTIDERPTRDADAIAAALAARGIAAFQWSSIHEDDTDPPQYLPYPDVRTLARAALFTLRAQPDIDHETTILVGHSLGAARALQIASEADAAALVLLAPAYITRPADQPPAPFQGEPHPADLLLELDLPILIVFGHLDPLAHQLPTLASAIDRAGATNITLRVIPDRGHNLSPETPRPDTHNIPIAGESLVGPIDPAVAQLIADWLVSALAE